MSTPVVALASSVGDDLAKFHRLVLPRSRGFGDKHRLGRSWATSSDMARLQTLYKSNIQLPISERRIEPLELNCNIMESQLAEGGVTVDVIDVAIGSLTANHWTKIIEPITLCQRYPFYLFLKQIKFVKYQKEVHLIKGWMSDNVLKELLAQILEGSGGDSKYSTSPKGEEGQYPGSGELMSTPMVAGELSGDDLVKFHGLVYLGQEGSEMSNLWGDHGRPVLRWRVINDNYGVNSKQRHVALQTDTLAGALNADMVARLASECIWTPGALYIYGVFPLTSTLCHRRYALALDSTPPRLTRDRPASSTSSRSISFLARRGFTRGEPLIAIPLSRGETNIMTIEELNALRETYSFPPEVQARLPDEGETITSTRPGEARNKKVLLGDTQQRQGWKSKLFFVSGDEWEIPAGTSPVFDEASQYQCCWTQSRSAEYLALPNLGRRGRRATIVRAEKLRALKRRGESENPHDQARRESPSRDDSIECLGSIRTNLRRLLPHIPDLTLLRWLGEAMSKRVSFKKIGEKLGKSGECEPGDSRSGEGVVIGRQAARREYHQLASKKGKADNSRRERGSASPLRLKRKHRAKPRPFQPPLSLAPGSPWWPRSCWRGVIPPADKEKVEKLTLDQTATKLFHVIGQALVLGSSLAVQSREAGELASLQEGQAASMETEIARLQKVAADLDQQLAESRAREQHTNDELAKAKSDRDSLSDQCGRSGVLVNELREALNKSKDSAVEEFKSSSEFMVAVEMRPLNTSARGLTSAK
ncbi:extra-large G-protein 1 [Actinidia rufa]|uniref:Extra-large G-protein 1 n=1 Tax=Actinidia rufa TaxID=165716 RepID=A0A7J0DNA9_9ERIC|nr:extra-large G-protein 1 [Actinidia rufa]